MVPKPLRAVPVFGLLTISWFSCSQVPHSRDGTRTHASLSDNPVTKTASSVHLSQKSLCCSTTIVLQWIERGGMQGGGWESLFVTHPYWACPNRLRTTQQCWAVMTAPQAKAAISSRLAFWVKLWVGYLTVPSHASAKQRTARHQCVPMTAAKLGHFWHELSHRGTGKAVVWDTFWLWGGKVSKRFKIINSKLFKEQKMPMWGTHIRNTCVISFVE